MENKAKDQAILNQINGIQNPFWEFIKGKFVILIILVIFFVFFLYGILDANVQRNVYIADVVVCEATVMEYIADGQEGDMRVSLKSTGDVIISVPPDNLWIRVKNDFGQQHSAFNSEVGVLLAQYVTFKPKYLNLFGNKGQDYEITIWGIEDIYPSYQEALSANPTKAYTANAVVKKKKTTKDGRMYLVLEADGRMLQVKTEKAEYDKYKLNDTFSCKLESKGNLVRFAGFN